MFIHRWLLSGYSIALITSALALLIRFAISPLLQESAPLLIFIVPVMLSAWHGGLGPGLLATGVSAIAGTYFFLPPLFSLNLVGAGEVDELVRVTIFLLEGLLISGLSQSRRMARARVRQSFLDLQDSKVFVHRSNQRLAALHDLDKAILEARSPLEIIQTALLQMEYLIPSHPALVVLFHEDMGQAEILADTNIAGTIAPVAGSLIPLERFVPDFQLLHDPERYQASAHGLQDCSSALLDLLGEIANHCIRLPLVVENSVIGELILLTTNAVGLNAESEQIATEVVSSMAIAIQQARLRRQLQLKADELEQRVKERTAQLQTANAELEAFSYSVAHDLRTPLLTQQGFAIALLEDYGNELDANAQTYVQRIYAATQQMDRLIEDLLAYSRLSQAELDLQPVDLNVVVNQAQQQLSHRIQQQQAKIVVAADLPQVWGHPATLVQVIANLIGNAVKFVTPESQPSVHIWAESIPRPIPDSAQLGTVETGNLPDAPLIRLWVQDNGIGISAEYIDRIFRVFERLHGLDLYPGTGVGLAIVRKGIERMGGQVGVKSQVGLGSKFWLELPQAQPYRET